MFDGSTTPCLSVYFWLLHPKFLDGYLKSHFCLSFLDVITASDGWIMLDHIPVFGSKKNPTCLNA